MPPFAPKGWKEERKKTPAWFLTSHFSQDTQQQKMAIIQTVKKMKTKKSFQSIHIKVLFALMLLAILEIKFKCEKRLKMI